MAETLFYFLSAGAVAFGVGVVSAKSPLMSVLSLLGSFVCLAGIYLLAGFQFLAAAQLLVYVGAIMVLFLFVIMLLNLDHVPDESPTRLLGSRRVVLSAVAAAGLALAGLVAASTGEVHATDEALAGGGFDSLDAIAAALFSRYALPFEAASVLLLATMIAVLVLAKRRRGEAS